MASPDPVQAGTPSETYCQDLVVRCRGLRCFYDFMPCVTDMMLVLEPGQRKPASTCLDRMLGLPQTHTHKVTFINSERMVLEDGCQVRWERDPLAIDASNLWCSSYARPYELARVLGHGDAHSTVVRVEHLENFRFATSFFTFAPGVVQRFRSLLAQLRDYCENPPRTDVSPNREGRGKETPPVFSIVGMTTSHGREKRPRDTTSSPYRVRKQKCDEIHPAFGRRSPEISKQPLEKQAGKNSPRPLSQMQIN